MNFGPDHKITKLSAQLQTIQDKLVAAILEEESLSKLDRLSLIELYGLFTTSPFLVHPLRDKYQEQLKEIAIREGATYFILDGWPLINCDHRNRGELVSFADELECEYENNNDDPDSEITVLKDRSTGAEIKITLKQLEDDIYDWCISKGKYGFYFDW